MNLFRNIRFYILAGSVVISIALYFFVLITSSGELIGKLSRYYALVAVGLLYIVLMIGPSVRVFPWIPLKSKLIFARRGLGVSVFYFAVLHSSIVFFLGFGGFDGLFRLGDKYLLAIFLSFTAEIILALMAATSFDYMIRKLGYSRWKFLHRFVYLAGFLIVIHALLLGSDFANLSSRWAQLWLGLLVILIIVEVVAWVKYLRLKRAAVVKNGV